MSYSKFKKIVNKLPINTFVARFSVWNYYGSGSFESLLKNKRSNIHNFFSCKESISDENLKDGITMFTGAKGRSGHSKAEIIIASGNHTDKGIGGTYFSHGDIVNAGVR